VVRHFQFIFTVWSPLSVVCIEVKTFNARYRAFLTAHEFTVVLDPQVQKYGGDLGRDGVGVAVLRYVRKLSRRLLVSADRYTAMSQITVQRALRDVQLLCDGGNGQFSFTAQDLASSMS
jgi:hypothetical protein